MVPSARSQGPGMGYHGRRASCLGFLFHQLADPVARAWHDGIEEDCASDDVTTDGRSVYTVHTVVLWMNEWMNEWQRLYAHARWHGRGCIHWARTVDLICLHLAGCYSIQQAGTCMTHLAFHYSRHWLLHCHLFSQLFNLILPRHQLLHYILYMFVVLRTLVWDFVSNILGPVVGMKRAAREKAPFFFFIKNTRKKRRENSASSSYGSLEPFRVWSLSRSPGPAGRRALMPAGHRTALIGAHVVWSHRMNQTACCRLQRFRNVPASITIINAPAGRGCYKCQAVRSPRTSSMHRSITAWLFGLLRPGNLNLLFQKNKKEFWVTRRTCSFFYIQKTYYTQLARTAAGARGANQVAWHPWDGLWAVLWSKYCPSWVTGSFPLALSLLFEPWGKKTSNVVCSWPAWRTYSLGGQPRSGPCPRHGPTVPRWPATERESSKPASDGAMQAGTQTPQYLDTYGQLQATPIRGSGTSGRRSTSWSPVREREREIPARRRPGSHVVSFFESDHMWFGREERRDGRRVSVPGYWPLHGWYCTHGNYYIKNNQSHAKKNKSII